MDRTPPTDPRAARYRVERASGGYAVVGEGIRSWENTLPEAADWRGELESPQWRRQLLPPIRRRRSRPPGAVVYGPVHSRRLGRSLGVDLTPPGCRVCSFTCVYCEFAFPGSKAASSDAWPTPRGVAAALRRALRAGDPLDSITLSGHGEPTLHPEFAAIVAAVLLEARRARPGLPVRILTNGTGAVRREVRRALDLLDERIVTVDAGADRVDRPDANHPLGAVVYALCLLRSLTLQSCFINGAVGNTDDDTVEEWVGLLGELQPRSVQIFTIQRRPPTHWVRPVAAGRLHEIARVLRDRTGIGAQVFE